MMQKTLSIRVPWSPPHRGELPVFPVFIPFLGCPSRCIFCAQHTQTGQGELALALVLDQAQARLAWRRAQGLAPVELAFFGGTFTAIPQKAQKACLDLAYKGLQDGSVAKIRCSTRPDSLSNTALHCLRHAACEIVELGIQSFDDQALHKAQRGYTGKTALHACEQLAAHGLRCGVQLMPGMPGVTPEIFLNDVRRALDAGASCLRFYPCLVIQGTQLEKQYQNGNYTPWSLETTLATLAEGWLMAHDAHVPVIRMGLAPEPSLTQALVAGPVHPALGAEVQALALLSRARQILQKNGATQISQIHIPRTAQGYFWGNAKKFAASWAKLGISSTNIHWTHQHHIEMTIC